MEKNERGTKRRFLPNAAEGGACRTLKAGYYKMGVKNFIESGNFGACAVVEAAAPRDSANATSKGRQGGRGTPTAYGRPWPQDATDTSTDTL